MKTTKVIFRKDKQEVFALFPEIAGTNDPRTCTCYSHLFQHTAADYHAAIRDSVPATPEEYAPLLKELRGIYEAGKNPVQLVICNRASSIDRSNLNTLKG